MLAWQRLTVAQKTAAAFLTLLFLGAGSPILWFATSAHDRLVLAGGLCCAAAVVLNPASFSTSAKSPIFLRDMPKVCRHAATTGLLLAVLGFASQYIS